MPGPPIDPASRLPLPGEAPKPRPSLGPSPLRRPAESAASPLPAPPFDPHQARIQLSRMEAGIAEIVAGVEYIRSQLAGAHHPNAGAMLAFITGTPREHGGNDGKNLIDGLDLVYRRIGNLLGCLTPASDPQRR